MTDKEKEQRANSTRGMFLCAKMIRMRLSKLLYALLFGILLISCSNYTEHMDFMGIPINGTLEEFSKKLVDNGLKPVEPEDKQTKSHIFKGKFAGEDAVFYVLYNERSNWVYGVSIIVFCKTLDELYDKYEYFKSSYKKKFNLNVNDEDTEFFIEFTADKSDDIIGTIDVYQKHFDSSILGRYGVVIRYCDTENKKQDSKNNLDDL